MSPPAQVFAQPPKEPLDHDRPVPDSEPRADLSATVDLPAAASCEERFDVALYQNKGIDIITWDERRGCVARGVAIRYFPQALSRARLVQLLHQHASRVTLSVIH